MDRTRARRTPRRGLVLLAPSLLLACLACLFACLVGCTEGATPDCSGANAAACAPSVSGDAATEASSIVIPDAGTTSDAGDGGVRDASADGG